MSDRCKECNQTTGYQGWANYPTWAFALWVDNERETYDLTREMARDCASIAPDHLNVREGVWPADRAAVYLLADRLMGWAEGMAPDLGASLWSDLLSSALADVDFQEIAESWLEEIKEEEEER